MSTADSIMNLNTADFLISLLIRDALERWSPSEKAGPDPISKCTKLAHMHRSNGNKYHSAKKFKDALRSYTLCIAYALDDGDEELAQGYGDRSAVFFELEKYAPCLYDINRALMSHCSNALRKELVSRKKRCLDRMKSSSAGGSGGGDKEVDEDATDPPSDREPKWRADMLSQFGNPLLPNASPKIKLKYDEIWGSHFVATADIKVGEPLLSEECFSTLSDSVNNRYKCCDYCVSLCDALIPCPSCAKRMYCSAICRSRAYDSYHRIECSLSYLIYNGSLVDAFAIRLFLIGTEQGAALENLMDTLSISDIFAWNLDFTDKPFRSDYLTVLRQTRGPFGQAPIKSIIENAVDVVVEVRKYKFFESVSVDRLKNAEVFATALLINNYAERNIHGFNADYGYTIITDSLSRPCEGLALLQNLFNHSCYPNVAACHWKREQILFAVRPVRKDDQLFIAYCDDFLGGNPKAERNRALGFDCQCEACSNNWLTHMERGDGNFETYVDEVFNDDLIPYNATARFEHNHVLDEIKKVVAPFLNVTTLLNLSTGEIFRIIADTMSLLYEVMVPRSFLFVKLRLCFLVFAGLYYGEREPDRTQNESLEFPKCRLLTLEELQAEVAEYPIISKAYFKLHFLTTVCSATSKISFYASKGTFNGETKKMFVECLNVETAL